MTATQTLKFSTTVEDLLAFSRYVVARSNNRFVFPFVLPLFLLTYAINFYLADKSAGISGLILVDIITLACFFGAIYSIQYPRSFAAGFSVLIVLWVSLGLYSGAIMAAFYLVPCLILGGFAGLAWSYMARFFYEGASIGPRELSWNESGISEKSRGSEVHYDWQNVTEIVRSGKHVFVFIGKAKGFVVPIVALESKEDAFIDALKAYSNAT